MKPKRTFHSFTKNGKERKDRFVLLKRTDAQSCPKVSVLCYCPFKVEEQQLWPDPDRCLCICGSNRTNSIDTASLLPPLYGIGRNPEAVFLLLMWTQCLLHEVPSDWLIVQYTVLSTLLAAPCVKCPDYI